MGLKLGEGPGALAASVSQYLRHGQLRIVVEDALEGRIRESARNIDTYLGAVDKETVREMLRTLIREVLVGPGAVTLCYTIPVLSGGPGKGAMTEEVALG